MQLDYAEIKDCLTRATPRSIGRLEQIFPEDVSDSLLMLSVKHGADSPEVLKAIEASQNPQPSPPAPAMLLQQTRDTDGISDEWIPDKDFPNYATNWDGCVRSLPGPRRKAKRLRPYPAWGRTRKGQYYIWSYFTLYKDGARHKVTQAQMLMNRQRTVWERSGKSRKDSSVPI